MSDLPRVYMAGPVFHNPGGYDRWRKMVKRHWSDRADWADPTEDLGREEALEMDPDNLVARDKQMINKCDAMLVGLTRQRTVGTYREMEYAVMMSIFGSALNAFADDFGEKAVVDSLETAGPSEVFNKGIAALSHWDDPMPIAIWYEPHGSDGDIDERNFSQWLVEAGPIYSSFTDCMEYIEREVGGSECQP